MRVPLQESCSKKVILGNCFENAKSCSEDAAVLVNHLKATCASDALLNSTMHHIQRETPFFLLLIKVSKRPALRKAGHILTIVAGGSAPGDRTTCCTAAATPSLGSATAKRRPHRRAEAVCFARSEATTSPRRGASHLLQPGRLGPRSRRATGACISARKRYRQNTA